MTPEEIRELIIRVTALEIHLATISADIVWLTRLVWGMVILNIGSVSANTWLVWKNGRKKGRTNG